MIGFFERLAQRAKGGDALAGLTVVRPLPALYQSARGKEADAEMSLEAEVEVAAEAALPPPATALQRAPPTKPASPPAGPLTQAPEQRVERRSGQSPRAPFAPPPDRAAPAVLAGVPDAATPRRVEVRPDTRQPTAADGAPQPQSPAVRLVQASRVSPLEQIVSAIEATPPAKPSGTAVPLQDAQRERGNAEHPPSVSIGRIDIVVAPPPVPAVPPERTRGFRSYTRLRRGLAR